MQLNHIEMTDLSAQACLGIKGSNAASWLAEHNITVPNAPNQWAPIGDSHLILRLGTSEFLLQNTATKGDDQADALLKTIETSLARKLHEYAGVYRVPRADAVLQLTGSGVVHMLAQVCQLDTQQLLQNHTLVMTHMARINAILLKTATQPDVYRLCFDASYHAYMIETISHLAKQSPSLNTFS